MRRRRRKHNAAGETAMEKPLANPANSAGFVLSTTATTAGLRLHSQCLDSRPQGYILKWLDASGCCRRYSIQAPGSQLPAACGQASGHRTSVCDARRRAPCLDARHQKKPRNKSVRGHGSGRVGKIVAHHNAQVGHDDPQDATGPENTKTLPRHRTRLPVGKVFEGVRRINARDRRIRKGNPCEHRRGARHVASQVCEEFVSRAANARAGCWANCRYSPNPRSPKFHNRCSTSVRLHRSCAETTCLSGIVGLTFG